MLLLIGELAQTASVSAKTIRYYESVGLLAAPKRTAGGYRDYDETAIGRLGFIRAAQAVGLTLGEIRGIIALRDRGETPCRQVLQLIEQHSADVAQRIAELQRLQDELVVLRTRARGLDPGDCHPDLICHLVGDSSAWSGGPAPADDATGRASESAKLAGWQ